MAAVKTALSWLLALSLAGCTISANLNTGYRRDAGAVRPAALPASLAVRRFAENRPPRVYTTGGRAFLTYVPLIPYVALPFERLDESARKAGEEVHYSMPPFEQYTYTSSMARAIAEDLAASGIFQTVEYVGEEPAGNHRYVLSGTMQASPLEKDMTSYGLGAAGVLLWFLPIPMGQTWASITLDLTVTDSTTGQHVWQRTLQHQASKWVSLYTASPTLVYGGATSFDIPQLSSSARVDRESLFSWHFEVLRQAMAGVPAEIATALQQKP